MREVLQRLNDASAATVAPAARERQLSEAELEQVAAAGGKAGASTSGGGFGGSGGGSGNN